MDTFAKGKHGGPGRSFALATVVPTTGSTPQTVGAKLLVMATAEFEILVATLIERPLHASDAHHGVAGDLMS